MRRRRLPVPVPELPPKAEPIRIIIMRTMDLADGTQERTIDLVEEVKPGLMRTYREQRVIGPESLPGEKKP